MDNLINKIKNQTTRDLTYGYSKNGEIKENEIIFSMVYDFAKNLPYSMDIQQEEYVSADFLNMTPYDFKNDRFFKWEDSRTVYKAMTSWGDTFKSGIVLQMCGIFQKMLSKQFPTDYSLEEDDFYSWGIDEMTSNKEYNKSFFKTLKSLPDYYKRVQETKNNKERRKVLNEIYEQMQNDILNKIGGFRQKDVDGNIIRETKPMIVCQPSSDLSMLYHFRNIEYREKIPKLKEKIKDQELKIIENSRRITEKELKIDEK